MRLKNSIRALSFLCMTLAFLSVAASKENEAQGCTVIGVGKAATLDGCVITSHTNSCSERRVHVVPG